MGGAISQEIREKVYADLLMRNQLEDDAARKAGPFRPVPLTVQDDRLLFWGDLLVAGVADAMHGFYGFTPATRERLIERWPQLNPKGYCSMELTRTTLNHLRVKQCPVCSGFFIGHHASSICSHQCRQDRIRQQAAIRKRKTRQWWRENRDDLPQECEHCGAGLVASRLTRRFCSDRCRKAASRSALAALEVAACS